MNNTKEDKAKEFLEMFEEFLNENVKEDEFTINSKDIFTE